MAPNHCFQTADSLLGPETDTPLEKCVMLEAAHAAYAQRHLWLQFLRNAPEDWHQGRG